jgi:hypothetical protein
VNRVSVQRLLGALTEWVTTELVDEALAECGRRDQKPGALSARFMVYCVLALALFQPDFCDDVAENTVGALAGMDEAIPNKSSFTRARQRLGAGVLEAVFRRLAGPVAPAGLDGAFWRGMRVAAVDGFVLDVRDTPPNRAAFGGPVRQFMAMMAAKVRRKLDNRARRSREADRSLKRPASKYSFRKAGQVRRPTRRVTARVLPLHPVIVRS